MPKVLKTNEIPDEPKELYIKLYCEQVGCSTSVTKKRAAQSWISLSHSKKKRFLKTCIQKQNINTAQRIQSTEPFLKQLDGVQFNENDNETVSEGSIDTEVNESECDNEENLIESNVTECAIQSQSQSDSQHTTEIDKDHSVLTDTNEQTADNTILEKSTYDILHNIRDVIDPDDETDDVNESNKEEIREPAPPSVKDTRELFMMLNKDKNKTYKDIPNNEKSAYRYILKKIRSEYIEKYIKYLESLSSKELYAHYLKES